MNHTDTVSYPTFRDPNTGKGVCGGGPDFCGKGCVSECSWKSECDPGWGAQWSNATTCPLNVCCSDFGFCGTTVDFCKGKVVSSPECGGRSADARTIGYYEGWNQQRSCGRTSIKHHVLSGEHLDANTVVVDMKPEDIPLGYYTHVFFAFALIHPKTFHVAPMDSETATHYDEVTRLKAKQPNLEVWIAIGGWAMNDPGPYRTAFSDMAKSESAQDAFFESLISFMFQHDFDGIDLDWEVCTWIACLKCEREKLTCDTVSRR